jgi:hypothetical protein
MKYNLHIIIITPELVAACRLTHKEVRYLLQAGRDISAFHPRPSVIFYNPATRRLTYYTQGRVELCHSREERKNIWIDIHSPPFVFVV